MGRHLLFGTSAAVFADEELAAYSAIARWSFVKQDLQHCCKLGCIPNLEKISPRTASVACSSLPGIFFSLTLEAGVVQPFTWHLCSCFHRHWGHSPNSVPVKCTVLS